MLSFAAAGAFAAKKLTLPAATTGVLVGFFTWLGSGYTGLALLAAFFVFGTLATGWKRTAKQRAGLAEQQHGRRNAGQVLANGGVAALLSLISLAYPAREELFLLMVAASLSAAMADTLSSELGNVYGSRFYNIITLKKDARGLNGVISLEGTAIGVAGSALIALVHALQAGFSIQFLWIVVAGTAGNLTDSLLGATLERSHRLDNDMVNCLNTLAGAATAFLLYQAAG